MAQENQKPAVTVTAVGLTDVGRVREHNEDSILVVDPRDGRLLGNGERLECDLEKPLLLAVADGMGGAAAGEIASQMAVTRFRDNLGKGQLEGATPDQIDAHIDQALQQANSEIKQEGEDNAERKGMGTTFTSVVVSEGRMFIAQIGDSRGYLLRKGTFIRLTRDQSLREQLIEDGTLTPEEAEKFGGGNIILQALGVEERVQPDTKQHELLRGDLLLLCSDGLSGMIDDAGMEQIVKEFGDDLDVTAQKLVDKGNENGGRDNISVVLARFEGEGLRQPLGAVSADSIDKAGSVFSSGSAPEVPNPMKKVGIGLAAVILAILVVGAFLWRTTAALTIRIRPANQTVRVELADGNDQVVLSAETSNGTVEFPGVDTGKYKLTVSSAGHHATVLDMPIDKAIDITQDVHLRPVPGTVQVTTELSHTSFKLTPQGTGHPIDDLSPQLGEFKADTSAPREFTNVAAGAITVEATREGFSDFEQQVDLPPGGSVEVRIQGMRAVLGRLEVVAPKSGFRVRVTDRNGEALVPEGTVTVADRPVALDVRVGTHTLTYELEGFESEPTTVKISKDAPTRVVLEVRLKRVDVVFEVAEGNSGTGQLSRKAADGSWTPPDRVTLGTGESRPYKLEPGAYKLAHTPSGAEPIEVLFEVPFGQDKFTVQVKGAQDDQDKPR